jgi:hypothetical protein
MAGTPCLVFCSLKAELTTKDLSQFKGTRRRLVGTWVQMNQVATIFLGGGAGGALEAAGLCDAYRPRMAALLFNAECG